MDEKHITNEAEEWGGTLAALQALSAEVNAGLLALSQNDLHQFEARIAAQQKICESLRSSRFFDRAQLRALAADLKKAIMTTPVQPAVSENPAFKLTTRLKGLAHSNRVYAGFVVQAQRVTQALLVLYSSRQGYSREGKAVTSDHTWSCEV